MFSPFPLFINGSYESWFHPLVLLSSLRSGSRGLVWFGVWSRMSPVGTGFPKLKRTLVTKLLVSIVYFLLIAGHRKFLPYVQLVLFIPLQYGLMSC